LVQVGVESTIGTLVPATKRLSSLSISPDIQGTFHKFGPMGTKFDTLNVIGKEWTESAIEGPLTYDECIYTLSTFFAMVSGVQIGVTGAYTWQFDIASSAPDTVKSLSIERGSSVGAETVAGNVARALNILVTRDEATVKGTMMGKLTTTGATLTASVNDVKSLHASAIITGGTFTIGDGTNTTPSITGATATAATVQTALNTATPNAIPYTAVGGNLGVGPVDIVCTAYGSGAKPAWTLTPTSITGGTISVVQGAVGSGPAPLPLIPILPQQFDVYLDNSAAALGTTKLLRVLSVETDMGDRFNPLWAINSANTSYATTYETKIKPQVKLEMERDAAGMALVAVMRAGSTRFMRLKATGGAIGAANYSYSMDMALQVSDAPAFDDRDGLATLSWTLDLVHDPTWSKAIHIDVVNTQSALG
jgi:hypothetical protein